jgi:CHAT domain-containing protein
MKFLYSFLFFLFFHSGFAQNSELAKIYVDSAEFLIHENLNMNLALRLNQKAEVFYAHNQNFVGLIHCQVNKATYWAQVDSFELGLQLINSLSADLSSQISSDSRLAALIFEIKAFCLWGLSRYSESYDVSLKALTIFSKKEDWDRFVGTSLITTYCIFFNSESHFSEIDEHIETTYETALDNLPQSRLVFKYIYQLYGAILYQQGRINQAIHITHEGLENQYDILNNRFLSQDSLVVAEYYTQLGKMYSKKNDNEQAISYYENALLMYQQINKLSPLVKLCVNLGKLYKSKGDDSQADYYFKKIPGHIHFLSKDPVLQLRENNFEHIALSEFYAHFQLQDSILNYYNKNIDFIAKHKLALDKAYINIGNAFQEMGDYNKAEHFFCKALVLEEKKFMHKGSKIASLYLKLGKLAIQAENLDRAVSYLDSVLILLSGNNTFTNSDGYLSKLLNKAIALEAFKYRGDVYMKSGELQKALDDFHNVIWLANYLRDHYSGNESKLLTISKLRPVYESAAAALWELNKGDESKSVNSIFDFSEHSKSTLLNENILKFRNSYTKGGVGIPKKLLLQEEKYIVQIDKCKEHIIEAKHAFDSKKEAFFIQKLLILEQKLDSFELVLMANFHHYRVWDHGRDSVVSPAAVQKHLNHDELLIEYFICDNDFFIVYISKEKVKVKKVKDFNPRHFKAGIREFRRSVSNLEFIIDYEMEAYKTFCKESYWLFKNYFDDEMLKDKKHLIIVPDRNLHYIPFEVLLTNEVKDINNISYHTLPYLIKDYSVHYEYSAAIMVNAKNRINTSNGNLLGFASSYNNNIKYQKLSDAEKKERTSYEINMHNSAIDIPGTFDEMNELKHHFKGDFFFGTDASEHQFKELISKNEYSVIHLAMHGIVDFENPEYSSLMFTENLDSLEDNLLYSYESQHINGKNTNLIVLSACKTGYGKYAKGEGIISLGRNFMYAGVPSIVMTLWELNDQTSVKVMHLFYQNLVEGQTKDDAMRNAKISYLQNNKGFTAQPFFWASFVCIGNQQPIPLEYTPHTWKWWALSASAMVFLFLLYYKKKSKMIS